MPTKAMTVRKTEHLEEHQLLDGIMCGQPISGLIKVSAQSHLKAMCLNLLKAANRLSAPAAA
ncbi:IS1106 transposase [Neisseria meningitidis]|nr:IS1106 transposase [Neisseria meningitidis]